MAGYGTQSEIGFLVFARFRTPHRMGRDQVHPRDYGVDLEDTENLVERPPMASKLAAPFSIHSIMTS
jgi:hypothetical protein